MKGKMGRRDSSKRKQKERQEVKGLPFSNENRSKNGRKMRRKNGKRKKN